MNKTIKQLLCVAVLFTACKKEKKTEDPSNDPSTTTTKYVMVIGNGAQTLDQGKSINLTAHLISEKGGTVGLSGVSWSCGTGKITGNVFTATNDTTSEISASATYEGKTYTAKIPVSVQSPANTQMFDVVPSAIMWSTNSGDIQLNPIYFGNQSSSFSYQSNNTNIVTVSSTGNVSFKATGSAVIKVTAQIGSQSSIIYVPVMVVGEPEIPLPVTRITLTPLVNLMFRGETTTLVAKAFNSAGTEVTSNVTFNFLAVQKEEDDDEVAMPITVSNNGVVSAKALGGAYVRVTAEGLVTQAEIEINPDTVIEVTPFFATFGTDYTQMPPTTKTQELFTAKTYVVNRANFRNKVPYLTQINNSPNLKWEVPLTGIAEVDMFFDLITLSNTTGNTCTATQKPNKFGSTFIIAHDNANGGVGTIIVNP